MRMAASTKDIRPRKAGAGMDRSGKGMRADTDPRAAGRHADQCRSNGLAGPDRFNRERLCRRHNRTPAPSVRDASWQGHSERSEIRPETDDSPYRLLDTASVPNEIPAETILRAESAAVICANIGSYSRGVSPVTIFHYLVLVQGSNKRSFYILSYTPMASNYHLHHRGRHPAFLHSGKRGHHIQ